MRSCGHETRCLIKLIEVLAKTFCPIKRFVRFFEKRIGGIRLRVGYRNTERPLLARPTPEAAAVTSWIAAA